MVSGLFVFGRHSHWQARAPRLTQVTPLGVESRLPGTVEATVPPAETDPTNEQLKMSFPGEINGVIVHELEVVDWHRIRKAFMRGLPQFTSREIRVDARVGRVNSSRSGHSLLDSQQRFWVDPRWETGHVRVSMMEVVRVTSPWTEVPGWLVLHVQTKEEAAEGMALNELGDLARTGRKLFAEDFMSRVRELADDSLVVRPRSRGATLFGSEPAGEAKGQVRWAGSEAAERRAIDLVVLRHDSIASACRPDIPLFVPSPGYLCAASGASLSAVRSKRGRGYVPELRTYWLDAVLVELLLALELRGVVSRLQEASGGKDPGWQSIAERFRQWKTQVRWDFASDAPKEQALASALRRQLRSDDVLDRVEGELREHAEQEQLAASKRVNWLILLLTAVTVLQGFIFYVLGR